MFWTISVILLVLWLLGVVAGSTEGYWVHLLFLFAAISAGLGLARGKRRG